MEIIYRANDGMEFTDEQDCVNYENRMNCLCDKKQFIAFNGNLKPYDITPNNIEGVLETMKYFVCLTNEAASELELSSVSLNLDTPNNEIKTNTYYGWEVTTSDTWEPFPNVWEEFNKRFDRLMLIESSLCKSVEQARGE